MLETRASEAIDPLSDALTRISLRAFVNVALDAGGTGRSISLVRRIYVQCCSERGMLALRKWRSANGAPQSQRLLSVDRRTGVLSVVELVFEKPAPAEELFSQSQGWACFSCNGGGDFIVVGTIFRFEGHLPSILFDRLPSTIYIDGSSDQSAVLRGNLDRFTAEMRGHGIGRKLILSHLAPIMLLQALRIYLLSAPKEANWLVALSHPRLSKVLTAMQTNYKRDWSLEQLARLANMSRSGFALTFKKRVGISPMNYLMNWRMQIACGLLQAGNDSLSTIASAVGYRSESAFSAAFARAVKCRPGVYRRSEMRF